MKTVLIAEVHPVLALDPAVMRVILSTVPSEKELVDHLVIPVVPQDQVINALLILRVILPPRESASAPSPALAVGSLKS